MKAHFLPERQEARNNIIIRKLKRLSLMVWLLLIASVVSGSVLYVRGPVLPAVPLLVSADNGAVLADAIVVSSDHVLGFGELAGPAELVVGSDRLTVTRVRTATIAGTIFTLFRIETSASIEPLSPTVVSISDALSASYQGSTWQGIVKTIDGAVIVVDPDLSIPPGVPVFVRNDGTALVGVTIPVADRIGLLGIAAIIEGFPELSSR